MRVLTTFALCCLLAGTAMAQRGGGFRGGFGGGGFHGGAMGGGFRGGAMGGGFRGGFGGGGFHGGFGRGGFARGGFGRFGFGRGFDNRFFGFNGFYGGYFPFAYSYYPYYPSYGYDYYPYYGYGYGYPYYGYPYYGTGYAGYTYPYNSGYAGYANYSTSPNVTVIYPPSTVVTQRANPVTHEYDQYGQEIKPSTQGTAQGTAENERPIYLIAFKNQTIRAAIAYWVTGQTLHYVTMQKQEMEAPLDTVEHAFSTQLNRERNVPFELPR